MVASNTKLGYVMLTYNIIWYYMILVIVISSITIF